MQREERRLAAIVAADVVGYSRLVEQDEEGTLRALRDHRAQLIDPLIEQHGGRIANTAGDSLLLEFPSAVDAVRFSVALQKGMMERNAGVDADRRMSDRIGINVGDVVAQDGDLLGDGVNVAARLEALAEAGGIYISRTARDQVRDRLDFDLEDMGEVEVKNIARPVRTFRVLVDGAPTNSAERRPVRLRFAVVAGLLVLAIVLAGGIWWWQHPEFEPADPSQMAYALPDKPSLVVLPFANLSDDTSQEFFADGLTEDIITDLSKISGLFVIARNSAFAYKQKKLPIRQVAEELGVRYILEGSVRRAVDKIRVNVQLIDTISGGHLWAGRFDGRLEEVFALQDRVTRKVVTALSVSLTVGEQARNEAVETKNPDAYDAFLRGWSHYRKKTAEDFAKAIPLLRRAVELDPAYSRAHSALASIFNEMRQRLSMTGSGYWSVVIGVTPEDSSGLAEKHLGLALKNPVPLTLNVSSRRETNVGRHEKAIEEARKGIALDANNPHGYEALARALLFAGVPMEAEVTVRKAIRLDPQNAGSYLFWLGFAQFGQEKFTDAKTLLTEATVHGPEDDRSLILLAATLGHLQQIDQAKQVLQRINELRKARNERLADLSEKGVRLGFDVFLVGDYALEDVAYWPFKEPADRERLYKGLEIAGVPATGAKDQVSPLLVAGATTIDAAQAKALHDEGAHFIDVRGKADFQEGTIPKSVHMDLDTAFGREQLASVAKPDEAVVIFCMGPRCLRSSDACGKAVRWGYEKVYYFRRGFPAWKAAGYSVLLP